MPRDLKTYEAFMAYMEYREKIAWIKLKIGLICLAFCGITKLFGMW